MVTLTKEQERGLARILHAVHLRRAAECKRPDQRDDEVERAEAEI